MIESYILNIQSFNQLSNIIQFFFNQKEIMTGIAFIIKILIKQLLCIKMKKINISQLIIQLRQEFFL